MLRRAALALAATAAAAALQRVPEPLALWTLQEATGAPRVAVGRHAYALRDGNASAPVARVPGGVLGPYAAFFADTPANSGARLFAARGDAPALTAGIAGPNATVTLVAWYALAAADAARDGEALLAGVWNEYARARQYALFRNLGACGSIAPGHYARGLAAHVSPVGGPTPGQRFCSTAACDPLPLPPAAWHCLANVYDGARITAFVNGTLDPNGGANPFPLTGGIYSPEAAGAPGAEFAVGANLVNHTVGGPPVWSNALRGLVGGVGVWAEPLSAAQVAAVCGVAAGFESLAEQAARDGWRFALPPAPRAA